MTANLSKDQTQKSHNVTSTAICWPKQVTGQSWSPGKQKTASWWDVTATSQRTRWLLYVSRSHWSWWILNMSVFFSGLSPQIQTLVGVHFMPLILPNTIPKEWEMHQETNVAPTKELVAPHLTPFLLLFPALCGESLGFGTGMSRLASQFCHKQIGWSSRRNFIFL